MRDNKGLSLTSIKKGALSRQNQHRLISLLQLPLERAFFLRVFKMKNKITDLNNHLFSQLEKLLDEDLTDEELNREIKRANAVSGIAANIIASNAISLKAMTLFENRQIERESPDFLRISKAQGDDL